MATSRRPVRNPQKYTLTQGGRRIRLTGGNVFSTKREAQDAARYLRASEGGEYRVRALKASEARATVPNRRRVTRRTQRNGVPRVDDLTIEGLVALSKRTHYAADRRAYERAVEKLVRRAKGEGDEGFNPAGGEAGDIDVVDLWNWQELTRTPLGRIGVRTTRRSHVLYLVRRPFAGAHYKVAVQLLREGR